MAVLSPKVFILELFRRRLVQEALSRPDSFAAQGRVLKITKISEIESIVLCDDIR
jgi:hypothetical protein